MTAVVLPACALMLDLPRRRRGRSSTGVPCGTGHGLQSRQRILRLVAAGDVAGLHAARADARRGVTACTVNAAWVLGRAGRLGRIAPGYDGDMVILEADDWRHVSYHSAAA